ncbi:cytochrome P450 [Lipomyces tetrasporus]
MVAISTQLLMAASLDVALHYLCQKSMSSFSLLLWFLPIMPAVAILCVIYGVLVYPKYVSPYKDMIALPNKHWLWGTYAEYGEHNYEQAEYMEKLYPGQAFTRFHGPLGSDYIMAQSVEAHLQVLQTHAYKFVKPTFVSRGMKAIIGNGLFFAEFEDHKVQRRIITPAFTHSHVKSFVPAFMNKIRMVYNIFDDYTKDGPAVFKQVPIFLRLTLDAIGEATFGVNMHAIDDENNELLSAYHRLSTPSDDPFFFLCNGFIPGFRYLPLASNRRMRQAKKVFRENCRAVLMQKVNKVSEMKVEGKDRDILSILLRDSEHNWTIDEIENQIMTFLLAGHETTTGALTWTLWALAKHPEVQEKLRQEVRAAFPGGIDDMNSADAVESLKYLNNVLREGLRVHPPLPIAVREAAENIAIENTFIKKGTVVQISIALLNKSPKLWGPDAEEFKPERWDTHPAEHAYGFSTFLQGARACIGRRLAEVELKCILAAFVAKYKFEMTSPDQTVMTDFVVTAKPLDGLPLKVTRLEGW